jgi:hypothetical protein
LEDEFLIDGAFLSHRVETEPPAPISSGFAKIKGSFFRANAVK